MKRNSQMVFTMAVLTFLLVQHFPTPVHPAPQTQTGGILGGILGGSTSGSLIQLNVDLCVFKTVGQFKSYCADDYLTLVDLQAYLTSVFPTCFPNGIVIGNILGLHVKLTVLDAVHVFLGLNTSAGVLTVSATDPTDCSGGSLAREIVVLTINLALDGFNPYWCVSPVPLCQLLITDGPCAGLSAGQVLALANSVIAGAPCPPGLTLDVLVDILVKININFRAALVNNLYLAIPKLIAVNLNLAC